MASAESADPQTPTIPTDQWPRIIQSLYPRALSGTNRVPPSHFFRNPLKRGSVPGTTQPTFLLQESTTTTTTTTTPSASASPQQTPKDRTKKKTKTRKPPKTDPKTENPTRDSESSTRSSFGTSKINNPEGGEASGDGEDSQTHGSASGTAPASPEPDQLMWNMHLENPEKPDVNVLESDLQDDFAQNHVLLNLQKLGERHGEVMFLISQFNFSNYLNKLSRAPPSVDSGLPVPGDIQDEKDRRGEFDLLIIHRRRGILVGELKSIGLSCEAVRHLGVRPDARRCLDLREDRVVAKRVRVAVRQLNKCQRMLGHLLQDKMPIRKAIFLPYVRTAQLRRILDKDSELKEVLASCLGVSGASDLTRLCCCHEQLSDPGSHEDVDGTLGDLKTWWDLALPPREEPFFPDDDSYLEVVGRFVGLKSTVEIHCNVPPHVELRTIQQVIPEFGRRLERLVLTPKQLDLMERAPPQVCLTGPPGTGKTVMLVLMALKWLRNGNDVYIVSTYPGSLAVSYLMEEQLNRTLEALALPRSETPSSAAVGRVHLKFYDMIDAEGSVERAVEELTKAAAGAPSFHVLMDEAKFTTSNLCEPQTKFFNDLNASVANLHFWTVCLGNEDIPPGLRAEDLTVPLRCAPRVQDLMGPAMTTFKIHHYSTGGVAYYVGDGPQVKEIVHAGEGHPSDHWPLDCEQCGENVAKELFQLGVGVQGRFQENSPPPLRYKDVFVLTRANDLQDDVRDDSGNITSQANGAIRGLRQQNVPLTVLSGRPPSRVDQLEGWLSEVKDAAVAGTDHVIVAHHVIISGLERKVLVFLRGNVRDYDDGVDVARIDARDKLYVVSRCTTQYINVVCSKPQRNRK